MIKRINLIEVQPFAITYMRLVQFLALLVALNMGAAAWQGYKVKNLEPELRAAKERVEFLKEEKKTLDKKPVVKKQETLEVGEYQDLFELLSAYPKWSGVIEDITASLPNAVWLTGITSSVTQKSASTEIQPDGAEGGAVAAAEKPSNLVGPETIKLTMTGLAADVDGLSSFVKNMQSSDHFSRTTIGESQKESFGFQFTLESYLNLDYVEQ